jgi:hypothetical protein
MQESKGVRSIKVTSLPPEIIAMFEDLRQKIKRKYPKAYIRGPVKYKVGYMPYIRARFMKLYNIYDCNRKNITSHELAVGDKIALRVTCEEWFYNNTAGYNIDINELTIVANAPDKFIYPVEPAAPEPKVSGLRLRKHGGGARPHNPPAGL